MSNVSDLAINAAVIEKMAGIAAMEVEGVSGLAAGGIDIKKIMDRAILKPVKAETKNGTIEIDIRICVKENAMIKDVAANVQKNVKEKLQNMTGNAVTNVNVFISDVSFEEQK